MEKLFNDYEKLFLGYVLTDSDETPYATPHLVWEWIVENCKPKENGRLEMNEERINKTLANIDRSTELIEQFLRGMKIIKDPSLDLEIAITKLADIRNTYTRIIRKELATKE